MKKILLIIALLGGVVFSLASDTMARPLVQGIRCYENPEHPNQGSGFYMRPNLSTGKFDITVRDANGLLSTVSVDITSTDSVTVNNVTIDPVGNIKLG